jgi:hypothetical protein
VLLLLLLLLLVVLLWRVQVGPCYQRVRVRFFGKCESRCCLRERERGREEEEEANEIRARARAAPSAACAPRLSFCAILFDRALAAAAAAQTPPNADLPRAT